MYRPGCSRSSMISSSRPKENSSSGSRCSRSGASTTPTSGSSRGRSPRRSRSPSPRGRRHHRSPSAGRSSRRSPSPRRSSRRYSPGRHSRSPGRHSRSPGRRSRSPDRRSRSPDRRSRSPGQRSRSPGRRSRSQHSESSVEQNLRITVGNDRYGIDTPERKRLCDRLGSPVDSLSDMDRDDLADGPIFSRSLLRRRSLERYSSREENQASPYSRRHDEDYHNRDVFLHQSDYGMNYEDKPREADREGELHRKSLYALDDRGREPKRPRYDRNDRLLDMNMEPQGFLSGTRKYRKRSFSRSPSPIYINEDFRELESARRKRKEEELSRNLSRELSGNSYVMTSSTNPTKSSEPQYLYRPDEAPAMPKKSILKKRVDDHSVQPEVFSSSSSSIKEPPLLSNHSSLPQRSSVAPFSLEVENFLKQFNKSAVAESTSKETQGREPDWRPFSGPHQSTLPAEQNSENFLKQTEPHESTSESVDHPGDFLLPHERASQDGSGFSRILGILGAMADNNTEEKKSFPDDLEDEEKFLYGDDDDDDEEEDCNTSSPSTQKLTLSDGKESVSQKVGSPPPSVNSEPLDESRPEYEKIHDLLKTIGLDIGVAEIGKLAARTQERLHGKKSSHSPDRYSGASSKAEMWERRRNRSETYSPESNQKHSLSPTVPYPLSTKSDHNTSKMLGRDNPVDTVEQSVPPMSLIPSAPPSLPNMSPTPTSVPQYRLSSFSPFPTPPLPQNYPSPTMAPPGYDAYGHYMAYAASGWPMYAQQTDPGLTDMHGLVTLTVPPNPTRPNLRVIETVSTAKGTSNSKRDDSVLVQIPTVDPYSKLHSPFSRPSLRGSTERISDEKNRASRKQKVVEEIEKLKAEQEARQKKLHYLRAELNRLSKQQGELLRKKRREKDGHKDPLLIEINRLQDNIAKEIAQLKMNADAAEKKQSELDKVAQILGINTFEKSRKLSSESKDSSENARTQEKTSDLIKESRTNSDRFKGKSPKSMESSSQPTQETSVYDYYDTGNHWCKDCNTTCGTMFDFFTHMHNKKHRQTLDPYNRPWAAKTQNEAKQEVTKRIDKIPFPAKGSEFLIPVTGYYCQLCSEFFGDQISAEQHVKSHLHNEKYKKHVDENPLYEERRNLDHQAGLSVIQETERRLRRKLCEKQKEEKDDKTTKTAKKEETKNIEELGDGNNECEISKRKEISNGEKCGIKRNLKKDDKEMEKKEERKEEYEKESKLTTFGKFSWRKSERDEKTQGKDITVLREESPEEGKESKSQSGKQNSKPIAIKLSGKTVIPHTSPWTPVVSTSSQTKIRPNLPIPVMVLRKTAVTTVSKPAPLNTFLSIKSSGTSAKPLPVVKEGNPDIVLAPDIISKAFGGEVVVLKRSQEDIKDTKEEAEEGKHESETKAVEHTNVTKAQEHAEVVAKAQAKARELAAMVKEQEVSHMTKAKEQTLERPHKRSPQLSLPPAPPLSRSVPQAPPTVFAPQPPPPPKQLVILADDMAPGVSEDDKNILEMPMCPRPLPPRAVFGEHIKKLKKNNSPLAAGNAKDLYDIFYNNSGRNPAESKLVNSPLSEKGKLNPTEKEKNTNLQVNSKPSCNPFSEESVCSVYTSSAKNPETEEVKDEKMMTTDEIIEIKTSVERDLEKVSFLDIQSTLSDADDLARSTSYPFHNEEEVGIPVPSEFNKKSSKPEKSELAVEIEKMSPLPLDSFTEPSVSLETAEHDISNDRSDTQISEISNNLPETISDSAQNDSYSKELSIDLKQDTNSGKNPQPSKVQYSDSELNKVELNSFCTNNEQEDFNGSQLKDGEDFSVVNVLESEDITNENFVNLTTICTTEENHEQIDPFPLSCESKELQVVKTEVLDSISSTNEIKPNYVEFMFLKHDKQKSSASDLELSGTEGRTTIETESANFPTLHPEMSQESLDPLPTEISIGHLGEVTLSFTDLSTEVLNTPTADNFDLNNTYPELSFEQSTTFSLDLENEGVSPKFDETKAMDSPRLKPNLELETIDFTLGNITVEHEVVDILPTEILNEDNADSPKLEMVAPICLESSKMSELDTDEPVIESEIINFVSFTPDDQEEKFCSVVSDAIIPHVVSPASKGDITEVSMPLAQLQDMPSVSMPQPLYSSKGDTPDKLLWSCGGENVQNQTVTCMESIFPKLKESGEVGGSGDSELYSLKNQMQTSIDKLTKTEEEKNEDKCEVENKLASEETDKSAEHLSWTSSH